MALSMVLSVSGFPPRRIKTSALVHISSSSGGFSIPSIELVTDGDVPGIDLAAFTTHAETAKLVCPVSKALAGVEIKLEARLVVGQWPQVDNASWTIRRRS